MPRTTRSRTRVRDVLPGSFTGSYNGVPVTELNTSHGAFFNQERCDDSHGRPPIDSPLWIYSTDYSHLNPVVGVYAGPNVPAWSGIASTYIPSYLRFANLGHLDLVGVPSAAGSMASLLARTSPSRPMYAPLTMLQDLVDIPGMLHSAAKLGKRLRWNKRLFAKDFGDVHLSVLFGWKPLLEDAKSFLDVAHNIHKRVGELDRLYSPSGLKRRIRLGSWTAANTTFPVMESYPILTIVTGLSGFTKMDRWGTVRWKPRNTFSGYRPTDAEILQQAKDALSGVTTEGTFQGAFDVIPWTWLTQWCVNVKDYVLSHSNTIPADPVSQNVMTTTVSTYRPFLISITKGYEWKDIGYFTYTTKERYIGSASLDWHYPILDGGQLSILGSLFVQRLRPMLR